MRMAPTSRRHGDRADVFCLIAREVWEAQSATLEKFLGGGTDAPGCRGFWDSHFVRAAGGVARRAPVSALSARSHTIALLVAWLVWTAASAYLVVYAQSFLDVIGQRLGLPSPFVLSAIGWIVFLVVLLSVLIVLSRVRSRVLQNATHNVGVVPSVSRFVVGAVCGLLLVICLAVPTLLFSEAFQPDPNQLAAEFQGSISFPMLKSISDRVRTWTAGSSASALGVSSRFTDTMNWRKRPTEFGTAEQSASI